MKTGVSDDRVREVRRVARLIAKKYPKLQKAFLIDYMESTHDRLESVDLGVVVSHGSYEPADYDFLRIYFAGEVANSRFYHIHHFYPEEVSDSANLAGGRGEILRKMKEKGNIVYVRKRNWLREAAKCAFGD